MPTGKLTFYTATDHIEVVKAEAAMQRVSVSRVVASYFEAAVTHKVDTIGASLVSAAVEAAVQRELASLSDRLAQLTARGVLEASTTRRLLFKELVNVHGLSVEAAKSLNDSAWQRSVAALQQPLETLLHAERRES